jgi:hypothetical protein
MNAARYTVIPAPADTARLGYPYMVSGHLPAYRTAMEAQLVARLLRAGAPSDVDTRLREAVMAPRKGRQSHADHIRLVHDEGARILAELAA